MAAKKDVLNLLESKYSKKRSEIIEKCDERIKDVSQKFKDINDKITEDVRSKILKITKSCGLNISIKASHLFNENRYDRRCNDDHQLIYDKDTPNNINVEYGELDIFEDYDKAKKNQDKKLDELKKMYEEMKETIILYGVNDELLKLLKKFEAFK